MEIERAKEFLSVHFRKSLVEIKTSADYLKKKFNRYYTFEELVNLIDEKTGMYLKFDGLMETGELQAMGASRENYYKALIKVLPLKSEYDTSNDEKLTETWVEARKNSKNRPLWSRFMEKEQRKVENQKFLKKSVNNFLKAQEEAHNNGSEYTHLNFYNQSSDDYINKLKNNPFGELYAVSKQDRDNYEVKRVDNHDEDKDSYVGRVTEIRLENDKEAVKKIQDWLDSYVDKKEKEEDK
jgi:hypothetical protein